MFWCNETERINGKENNSKFISEVSCYKPIRGRSNGVFVYSLPLLTTDTRTKTNTTSPLPFPDASKKKIKKEREREERIGNVTVKQ